MEYQPSYSLTAASGKPVSFAPATGYTCPDAANENLKVKSDWMTPAEALQTVVRLKDKMRAENARNFSLFFSASRRKTWDEINACEKCLRWQYFRND